MKLARYCIVSLSASWASVFAGEIDLLTTNIPSYLTGNSSITDVTVPTSDIATIRSPRTSALWDIDSGQILLGNINATYPIIADYYPEAGRALVYMERDSDLALYDLGNRSIIRTFDLDAMEREIRLGGQPPIQFESDPDFAIINFSSTLFRLDLNTGGVSQVTENENGQPYPESVERIPYPKQGKYLEVEYRQFDLFLEEVNSVDIRSIATNEVLASISIDPDRYIRGLRNPISLTDSVGLFYSSNQGAVVFDLSNDSLTVLPPATSSSYLGLKISSDGANYGIFIDDELLIKNAFNHETEVELSTVMEINDFQGIPTSFAFSPTNDSLFVGDSQGVVREWKLSPTNLVRAIGIHSAGDTSEEIEVSPNGTYVASISSNGETLILQPDTSNSPFAIQTSATTRTAHFSDDSETIALIDRGYRVSAYQSSTGLVISEYPDTRGAVSFVTHLDDPDTAIIVYETGECIRADPTTGAFLENLPKLPEHEEVHDIAKRSGFAALETAPGVIQVIDIFTNELQWSTSEYADININAKISDNGRYLLLYFRYSDVRLVRVVDLQTNTDRFMREGPEIIDLTHANLSSDGRWLAVGRDRSTDIYDLESNSSITVRNNRRPANLFSPNGEIYYAVDMAGSDLEVEAFDTTTGSFLHFLTFDLPTRMQFHLSNSYVIDLFDDGRLAIYSRGSLIIIDPSTDSAILTLPEIDPFIGSSATGYVSISQDGSAIFSDNRDGLAQSWRSFDGDFYPCRIVPDKELFSIQFEPRPNAYYQLQTTTRFTNWEAEFNQAEIQGAIKSLRPIGQPHSPQFWRIVEFSTEN